MTHFTETAQSMIADLAILYITEADGMQDKRDSMLLRLILIYVTRVEEWLSKRSTLM